MVLKLSCRTSNRRWNLGFLRECWKQRAIIAHARTHALTHTHTHTHTHTQQAKTVKTIIVCQIADGNCFLGLDSKECWWCRSWNCVGPASHSEQKAWNADIQCSPPPWQCMCEYSCLCSSTAGSFQLGVVWPPALQSLPCSKCNWFLMTPSIATKFQYVNSPFFIFLLTTCFGPYGPSSGEIYN
jgi:hypothetical protein